MPRRTRRPSLAALLGAPTVALALALPGQALAATINVATGLGDRVFDGQLGTATLRDLTVTGGHPPAGGPGANGPNQAAMSGLDSDGGHGDPGENGGGIANAASLTLTRVTVTDNT